MSRRRVCLLGAGVVGLSAALATADILPAANITVVARDFTPNTTSDGAFGLWEPYLLKDTPADDVRRWGSLTLTRLQELAHSPDAPRAGVFTVSGYFIFKSQWQDPLWKDMVPFFRHMKPVELQQYGPEYVHGWFFTSTAAECRFYLPWLTEKLKQVGVTFIRADIGSLSELAKDYDVIINCTGLGARDLVKDTHVTPIRGQVIRVSAPWVKHFLSSEDEDLYILPGADSVVLGGTHAESTWGLHVDEDTKKRILQGCQRIMPSLKNAQILRDWVGLRPSRTRVRLEAEMYQTPTGRIKVVHNYGHGGAGISLHWGCALETADLVKALLEKSNL